MDEEQWLRDGLATCDTILKRLNEAGAVESVLIEVVKVLRAGTEAKLNSLLSEAPANG